LIPAPTTLALVDGDPVVGRALKVLLQGAGYNVRSLGYPFGGDLGALLGGARLLLLPPSLTSEAREALLGDIKVITALASLPTVALMGALDKASQSDVLSAYVPWPCRIEALVQQIEAALGEGAGRNA
jgi:hypothetical protein